MEGEELHATVPAGPGRPDVAQGVTFPVPMPQDALADLEVVIPDLGTVTDSPATGPRSVDVLLAVVADLVAGRSRTQYRLLVGQPRVEGEVDFEAVRGENTDPSLTVLYRER